MPRMSLINRLKHSELHRALGDSCDAFWVPHFGPWSGCPAWLLATAQDIQKGHVLERVTQVPRKAVDLGRSPITLDATLG